MSDSRPLYLTPESLQACANDLAAVVKRYSQSAAAHEPIHLDTSLENGFYTVTVYQERNNGPTRPLVKLALRWSTQTERDLNLLLGFTKRKDEPELLPH